MFSWLRTVLAGFDRQSAASDRAAVAMEDIAATLESARDQLKSRLGIETAEPQVVKVLAEAEPEPARRGRSK
jgi:hypothetical protein